MKTRLLLLILISICINISATEESFKVGGLYYKIIANTENVYVRDSVGAPYGINYTLSKIIIPPTIKYNGKTYKVTKIGSGAFGNCANLETIEIGENIEEVDGGFGACPKLKHIIWRAKNCEGWDERWTPFCSRATSGYIYVYHGSCYQIESIEFTDEVEYIPEYLCWQMDNLKTIHFGKNIKYIGEGNCYDFKNVDIYIKDLSAYCNISSTELMSKFRLFLNDKEINNLIIPSDVTLIKSFSFHGCLSIKSLEITNNVEKIEADAFSACTDLSKVTFSSTLCEDLKGKIFDDGTISEFSISNNVTHIPSYICNNQPITQVVVPQNVKSIGENAFSGCDNLSSINWNAIDCNVADNGLFDSSKDKVSTINFGSQVKTIPHHLCMNMTSLTSVIIPNGVTKIGNGAFQGCNNITSLSIPNTVSRIGASCFEGCTAWRVVVPENIKYIGRKAFKNTFTYNLDRNWSGNLLYIDNYLIESKVPTSKYTESIKSGTVVIADGAFENNNKMTSITIPNTVTHIGNGVFNRCSELRNFNIPKGIVSIGDSAFNSNGYLGGNLTFASTLKEIGKDAFRALRISGIYAYMKTPPSITDGTFGLSKSVTNTPVYVHKNYLNNYYQAEVWKQFDIQPIDVSVMSVTINVQPHDVNVNISPSELMSADKYEVSIKNNSGATIGLITISGDGKVLSANKMTVESAVSGKVVCKYSGLQAKTTYTSEVVAKDDDNLVLETKTNTFNTPAESYNVTFLDWDGIVLSEQTIAYGENAVAPANPSREGYTFSGWDKTFTNVTRDLVVTATYKAIEYTVMFVDYDSKILKAMVVEYGKAAVAPENPTREGYTFSGWDKDFSCITSSITIKATYTINKYEVTFVDYDSSVLKETQIIEYGNAAIAPENPTRDGYVFSGWDKDFSSVKENMVVTATYEIVDAVEDIANIHRGVQKVFEDDIIYILLPDGRKYNLQGAEVR